MTPVAVLPQTFPDEMGEQIAHVQGWLHQEGPGQLAVQDQSGVVALQTIQPRPEGRDLSVDGMGLVVGSGTNLVLQSAFFCEQGKPFDAGVGVLPTLTTAAQVKELSREEARRGYPVMIRGIVIATIQGFPSFVIQDSTSGIFVMSRNLGRTDPSQIGELWQINGVTAAGDFAPTVVAKEMQRLDQGRMPDPLLPTWDQLITGSADTQYGEIQGVVTDVQTNTLTLLCRGGKLRVSLPEISEKGVSTF